MLSIIIFKFHSDITILHIDLPFFRIWIKEEFTCLTGKHFKTMCDNWERYRLKVIDVALQKFKGKEPKDKIQEAKQAGESFKTETENLAIFELLLHLLPNSNTREMVKGVKTSSCLSQVAVFLLYSTNSR